jgi:hypothetical protein
VSARSEASGIVEVPPSSFEEALPSSSFELGTGTPCAPLAASMETPPAPDTSSSPWRSRPHAATAKGKAHAAQIEKRDTWLRGYMGDPERFAPPRLASLARLRSRRPVTHGTSRGAGSSPRAPQPGESSPGAEINSLKSNVDSVLGPLRKVGGLSPVRRFDSDVLVARHSRRRAIARRPLTMSTPLKHDPVYDLAAGRRPELAAARIVGDRDQHGREATETSRQRRRRLAWICRERILPIRRQPAHFRSAGCAHSSWRRAPCG